VRENRLPARVHRRHRAVKYTSAGGGRRPSPACCDRQARGRAAGVGRRGVAGPSARARQKSRIRRQGASASGLGGAVEGDPPQNWVWGGGTELPARDRPRTTPRAGYAVAWRCRRGGSPTAPRGPAPSRQRTLRVAGVRVLARRPSRGCWWLRSSAQTMRHPQELQSQWTLQWSLTGEGHTVESRCGHWSSFEMQENRFLASNWKLQFDRLRPVGQCGSEQSTSKVKVAPRCIEEKPICASLICQISAPAAFKRIFLNRMIVARSSSGHTVSLHPYPTLRAVVLKGGSHATGGFLDF